MKHFSLTADISGGFQGCEAQLTPQKNREISVKQNTETGSIETGDFCVEFI